MGAPAHSSSSQLVISLSALILDTAGTSGEMGNWGEASLLFLTSRLNVYRVNIFTVNIYQVNILTVFIYRVNIFTVNIYWVNMFTANINQVQPDKVNTYWVNIFKVGSTFIAEPFVHIYIFCTAHVLVLQLL